MLKRPMLLLLIPALLCGFGDGDKPDAKKKLPQTDTTDATIKGYIDGVDKVSYAIALHDDPKAGQYWEVGSESYDIGSSTRWQVTRIDGDTALIERHLKLTAEMFKSDYVIAYRVNLKPEQGKPQVTRAWVGKPGEAPRRISVKEMPPKRDKPESEGKKEGDDGEAFLDLQLAGATWKGRVYTHKFDDMTTKIWVAEGGWFDKVIKTTAGDDYVQKLTAFGTDAKALLKWPEKWQEAGDDKPGTGD